MGVSTDGIVGYGVLIGETEPPFGSDWWEDQLEEWWREINGYEPIYQPWDENGGYAEGWESGDERFSEYSEHRRQWLEDNPVPVVPVNYCSDSHPMWMLAVPGTLELCNRGYPTIIYPNDMKVDTEKLNRFLEFIDDYDVEYSSGLGWYLMSYYG